jgi:hypothetical protein
MLRGSWVGGGREADRERKRRRGRGRGRGREEEEEEEKKRKRKRGREEEEEEEKTREEERGIERASSNRWTITVIYVARKAIFSGLYCPKKEETMCSQGIDIICADYLTEIGIPSFFYKLLHLIIMQSRPVTS